MLERFPFSWPCDRRNESSNQEPLMSDMEERDLTRRPRLASILRDVQFWIPVVVLIGGLLVLRWIG